MVSVCGCRESGFDSRPGHHGPLRAIILRRNSYLLRSDCGFQPKRRPFNLSAHSITRFLVSESEFDTALKRIREAGVEFYADFDSAGPGEINHLYGGRGVYFHDPSGHLLEIITQPYGPEPQRWQHSHS